MTDINRNNYEKYFLDFHDGQLSLSDERILMSFLNENQDLKDEFELFEHERLVANEVVFYNKGELKKTEILSEITTNNFDELCIARIEGDLNEKETFEFDEFIKGSPAKQKEYGLYELIKIPIEFSVLYKNKASLKKKDIKLRSLKRNYTLISVAASIVLLITLYLFIPKETEITNDLIVEKLDNTQKTEIVPVSKKEQQIVLAKNERTINIEKTERKVYISNKMIEVSEENLKQVENEVMEKNQIANLFPLDIKIDLNNRLEIQKVSPINLEVYAVKENDIEKYMSVKLFLAAMFNKRVLKKDDKSKIEFFDIAQAGVKGINKLTGSKMSLKRKYDKNGIPDKTEFNSRLIAFSTPIKKD